MNQHDTNNARPDVLITTLSHYMQATIESQQWSTCSLGDALNMYDGELQQSKLYISSLVRMKVLAGT